MEDIIGIDVGGTSIKWGRADANGKMIAFGKVPTERENPRGVLTKVADIVAAQEGVTKIGLSFPGMVAPDGSLTTSGAIAGLEGTPLRAEIEELTGLPTAVVNDAHSAGQAERWVGAGADCANFVCMTIGTGIGGAVFVNGKLYRGFRGAAGELSMVLLGTGETTEEMTTDMAAYIGAGILGLARDYSEAAGLEEWNTDTWGIMELAEQGDEIATRAVDRFFNGLTTLMVDVLTMLDPQRILLGGGVSERPGFVEEAQRRFAEKISRHPHIDQSYVPEVRGCGNGNEAGVLGAIYTAHTTL